MKKKKRKRKENAGEIVEKSPSEDEKKTLRNIRQITLIGRRLKIIFRNLIGNYCKV